ncbi:hypothetical protein PENTCL1PPCAC_25424 [Pristionchus entomophagus]|uniref:Uncharacterized protein n=1 Tax=Pristionchus entomophagus TaxID=358040 RepID=A0AAV5UA60_9BILA|nr:hypothetical protein PENTCL1PPCAC_25424 [Pristionchus entomophagus]
MKPVDRRANELTQLTPLMAQNGAAMMHPAAQMYPGGYQMPPGYPSAPATPLGMGTAPPPTMMYPHAPPATPMQPTYQHHGYASGSSTPVNPNARSPARSRKAAISQMGMDNAAAWLGQHNPHLSAPGTPAYSPAPSVMSYAGMSTMTGFNDDAISVMSVGTNLVELQPATSHQTENIDPARMGATIEQAKNCALRMTQADQSIGAAHELVNLLSHSNPERFPKEVLSLLISKALETLCMMPSMQLNALRTTEMLKALFALLLALSQISSQTCEMIVTIAQGHRVFEYMMNVTCQSLGERRPGEEVGGIRNRLFIVAVCFLNRLVRDEQSAYSKQIMQILGPNRDFFSLVFRQMINTQVPTAIEFVVRMLRCGDRRIFREKINEQKIVMLLTGTAQHQGLLYRYLRKKESGAIHNTLHVIELLVRNDSSQQTPIEAAIQKWFIDNNVFFFLSECVTSKNTRLLDTSLKIIAALAGSPHIRDDVAVGIADMMLNDCCLQRTEMKLQNAIIHTISILTTRRPTLQRFLADKQAFNYACHLVRSYAKRENIEDPAKDDLLEMSLNFCLQQLRLQLAPEESAQLWAEGGAKATFTTLFFDPSFAACLLNIIVCGSSRELIKTRTVQIMVAGLSLPLPTNRFSSVLFNVLDEINRETAVAALYNAVNAVMLTSASTASAAAFIRAATDLLVLFVEERLLTLELTAKSRTSTFPLNILFCDTFKHDDAVKRKVLLVCKKLVEDQELQQAWAQHRDKFRNLELEGNYEIAPIATDILGMIGIEGENDFSISIANSMTTF